MQAAKKEIQGYRFEGAQCEPVDIRAIAETSVTINVNGEDWLALLCTPLDLEALAVGFLFNEGLIQSKDEIASVRVCPTGETVDVWLAHAAKKPAQWRRTSGCAGGVTAIAPDAEPEAHKVSPTADGIRLRPEQITALVKALFDAQELYQSVGGVHTSALSDGQRILVSMEDIGRHNTLDKIAGHCLLDDIFPSPGVLLTTGRVSSEMMQKASRIRASVVISRTAPSTLSIDLADQSGITLIGYARQNRFTVYTHPERIISDPPGCLQVED
jgi:FdhD protein